MVQFTHQTKPIHTTQKPVALFECLIRTYTNPGDIVLDNTAGSGTTAVAAENADRLWICIERDQDYAAKAIQRIRGHVGEAGDRAPMNDNRHALTLDSQNALLWFAIAV